MSETRYVSTVGYLVGDSCLSIPRLVALCRHRDTKLVCGTYALPVFEFAQKQVKGCDFEIVEKIEDPDDGANKYTPGWGAPAYMRAASELQEKHPGIIRLDECTTGLDAPLRYPLELREAIEQGEHTTLHPYTRHEWKNLSDMLYRLKFKRPVHLVGCPNEPELKTCAEDLREKPFGEQALDAICSFAVFGVASAFTCLASLFLKRQYILSYTDDVSFWPHNPNAVKLKIPSQKEAQDLIDREGL